MQSGWKWAAMGLPLWMALFPGCTCEERTRTVGPKLELPSPEAGERTLFDFGTVQVGMEHVREVRLRNGGTSILTVTALTVAAPFGTRNTLPLEVGVGQEEVLLLTYAPQVADQRQTGRLTLASDDRSRPEVVLDLAGQGIQAVATATPNPIDFKDVYLGESKKITITVSNAGTNELDLKAAALVPAQPTVTGSLSSLVTKLPAGGSASAELTFAPTQMAYLSGALEITLDPLQGEKLTLPLAGRGVIALPRMCFKLDGEAETCTDPTAASPNLQVRFPSRCDGRIYSDGGCPTEDNQKSGKLYFRNEGNLQVSYTAQFTPYPYTKDRCGSGAPPQSDFTFSNAPLAADGGFMSTFAEGTVKLPANPADPKPWESSPVTLLYQARSRCREEATDLARVVWTRQGEPASHQPTTILLTADGTSQLPRGVSSDWNCGALSQPQQVPCRYIFYGVNNAGDAPLTVSGVEFWEEIALPADSGITDAGGPNGGYFSPCDPANPSGPCAQFAWDPADGGDPNQYAPHQLSATTNPAQPTQKILGTLVFGPNGAVKNSACPDGGTGCAQPNKLYRVYAVIRTNDPYNPDVNTRVQGVAQPPP